MNKQIPTIFLCFLASSAWAADEKNASGFEATRSYTSDVLSDSEDGQFGGLVVETMNVGDYTYVRFVHGKQKLWLAASKTAVKKGDQVSFSNPQTMHNFHSKTLNKTFDEIYFVSQLSVKSPAR